MNDPNQSRQESGENPDAEARLRSLLAPLTSLRPSAELRPRNRDRILAALDEQQSATIAASKRPRWWRRQIRVPVPAAAVVVLWLAASTLLPWIRSDRTVSESRSSQPGVQSEKTKQIGDVGRIAVYLEGDASFSLSDRP